MGEFDPVPWKTAKRAVGAPAAEITAMVGEIARDVSDEPPYEAVMVSHEYTRGLARSTTGLLPEGTAAPVSRGVWVGSAPPVPPDTVRNTPTRHIAYGIHPTAQAVGFLPAIHVKATHDALDTAERSVPSAGEPFVTAYLLEKEGVIAPEEGDYRSLVDRRPDDEVLRELFRERERTLWWIGLVTGVHPSLVTYWLYEADVPLMERNYGEESMERIRAVRERDERGM